MPARNSVPSLDQYERAITRAVTDFNKKAGPVKVTTLSIVSGTASYALPTDYISLVALAKLTNPGGIVVSGQTLIPISSSFSERWTISGGQITFYPTPTYTLSRQLTYRSGWILSAGAYGFGEDEAEIILLHAAATALGVQAFAAAQEAWEYQIGDEKVSKRALSQELEARGKNALERYEKALQDFSGKAQGMRSHYDLDAYS